MRTLLLTFILSSFLFAFEEINANNFDEKIKSKNVIVDFYAVWCPPCKIVAKHLKIYDKKSSDDVTIYKIDIDKNREILARFDIKSLPTLVYIKEGKPVFKEVGVRNHKIIAQNVKKYLINN